MSVSAFFNTEITSTSPLENAGNFCLSPLRTLFGGRSFSVVSENEKVIEWNPPKKSTLEKVIMIAVSILLFIPATIAGVIIKGLAFMSEEVRHRHNFVIEFTTNAPPRNPLPTSASEEDDGVEPEYFFGSDDELESAEEVDYTRRGEITQEIQQHFGRIKVVLKRGDITKERCDVIVNAANKQLLAGGGVDHAIHSAAGPRVQQECLQIPTANGIRCPEGEVRDTGAGTLPAKRIFHTVGPRWAGGEAGESSLLRNCYVNCITKAVDMGFRSIAFPSISTGIFRYPLEQAAKEAFKAISDTANDFGPGENIEVRFILFSKEDMDAYTSALENSVER
ncbi:macro domain-containing protein [Estrella lausannensis]|uniref:Putative membrane protein n=1 Tax=Estrella lausannensis TaxID=483423 RepID=A0A0H5DNU7_9BACT|nr:macro domain-containing protein [Estrella lausannensis]CRX37987.1 putative membrane protein [Estrella lausannensis]